ncbi:hypothetical protein CVT24_002042 [Panaeolus cyanescens]|uniref:DNA replication checkpoint mediator MRC1 domain-containing protein n=1 Tax=Panaeolus cyanescens TaxID=181874 RepID=A0A409YHJ2_9AGAR|nr:hypothetical protein CVT24_002042 [Panaeolus cyanescens]
MPLAKDYSLVVDSTAELSPTQDSDDLAHIKRAPRTYGRKRDDAPVADDPDTSFSSSQAQSSLGSSVHKTAPPGLADSIPPSSPTGDSDGESLLSHHSSSSRQPEKFQFAWRRMLKDVSDDDEPNSSGIDDAPKALSFGNATLLLGSDLNTETQALQPNMEPRVISHPLDVNDIFTTNSQSQPTSPSDPKGTALSKPPQSRLKRNNRVIADFDSDGDDVTKGPTTNSLSFSSDPSPRNANLFTNTPNSQNKSPSTRPTSDDEDKSEMTKQARKGKARADVQPLDFSENLDASLVLDSAQKNKKKKTKAPTKKDQAETVKERGRMAAQTAVEIPRDDNPSRFTVQAFMTNVASSSVVASTSRHVEEDPILTFSSPPLHNKHLPKEGTSSQLKRVHPVLPNDDDDELPTVSELLAKKPVKRHKELLEVKKRVLIASKQAATDDGDDDLVIQGPALPKVNPASTNKSRLSAIRKQQNQLARIPAKKSTPSISIQDSPEKLQAILKTHPDQQTLNRVMAVMAGQKHLAIKKQKVAEYEKHGGQLRPTAPINPQGFEAAVKEIAQKGLKAVEARAMRGMEADLDMGDADEEDGDDEDWEPPNRGSASPESSDHEGGGMVVEEASVGRDEDDTMVENDTEDMIHVKTKSSRKVLLDSDSDEEPSNENLPPRPSHRRNLSPSASPVEDDDDKENDRDLMYDHDEDKENTTLLRRSRNTNVPVSPEGSRRAASLSPDLPPRRWDTRGRPEDLSLAPRNERVPFRDLTDESPFGSPVRQSQSFAAKLQQASPLPSTLVPEPTLKPVFGTKGKEKEGFGGFSQFSQSGEGSSRASQGLGLTQQFATTTLLEPGFTDLFDSPSANGSRKSRAIEASLKGSLDPPYSLDLTQDIALEPAFQHEVNITKLNKAQAIVEQDQEDVLESVALKHQPQKKTVYVNDFGFLTQTRPEVGTPEIYQPSPTQRQHYRNQDHLVSPSERQPLRTISLDEDLDGESPLPSPSISPSTSIRGRRRLRKKSSASALDDEGDGQQAWNAYSVLMRAGKEKGKAKMKEKSILDKELAKEFFEDEAAESDDDNMFGLGIGKNQKRVTGEDDDELAGEDLDKNLEELVDDEQMDDETVAAQQVHEKYKEQLELDDQAVQKNVEEVIRGEKRKRARKGLGIDDSDESDDEDDANRRARRKMMKGAIKERGDIRDLETNDATRAFAETYNQSLRDSDDEFGYLKQESQLDDLLPNGSAAQDNDVPMEDVSEFSSRSRLFKRAEANDDDDDDDFYVDENVAPTGNSVSYHQLRQEIQEKARIGLLPEDSVQDMEDVSWIDEREEEKEKSSMPKVKRVSGVKKPAPAGKKGPSLLGADSLDDIELDAGLGPSFLKPSVDGNSISKTGKRWLAAESSKARMGGTSRSVGGSAITGHAKTTAKGSKDSGAASSGGRKGFLVPVEGRASTSTKDNRLKTAPSLLAAITDKSRNFGPS